MEKQKFSLLKPVRNQVPTSHTLATLRRRGDEVVGLLLALLLLADRGLIQEADEAIDPGPLQHFAAEWIPALPISGSWKACAAGTLVSGSWTQQRVLPHLSPNASTTHWGIARVVGL